MVSLGKLKDTAKKWAKALFGSEKGPKGPQGPQGEPIKQGVIAEKTQAVVNAVKDECGYVTRKLTRHPRFNTVNQELCDHEVVEAGLGMMGDALTCVYCGKTKYPEVVGHYYRKLKPTEHNINRAIDAHNASIERPRPAEFVGGLD